MSFQKNDESDFDFSVIDHKAAQQCKLNFSVESLLTQGEPSAKSRPQSVSNNLKQQKQIERTSIKNIQKSRIDQNNNFLNDLQKFQKSLSFETQIYNVYHQQSNQQINTKSYLYGKSNSHLKTTKENSNDLMKSCYIMNQNDYGHLIIDFTKKKQKFKEIQNKKKGKIIEISSSKQLKNIKSMQNLIKPELKNQKNKILKIPKNKKQKLSLLRLAFPIRSKSKQYSIKTKITSSTPRSNSNIRLKSPKQSGKSLYFDSLKAKNNTKTQNCKDNKYTINSLRQSNPYNEYFGVEARSSHIKSTHKLSSISINSSDSAHKIQTNTKKVNLTKKGLNKSKTRIRIGSPLLTSQQAQRFKKKRV